MTAKTKKINHSDMKINIAHFKSINYLQEKSSLYVKSFSINNHPYYEIVIRKLIPKNELGHYENFYIIRTFKELLLIENKMVLMKESFRKIVKIVSFFNKYKL